MRCREEALRNIFLNYWERTGEHTAISDLAAKCGCDESTFRRATRKKGNWKYWLGAAARILKVEETLLFSCYGINIRKEKRI